MADDKTALLEKIAEEVLNLEESPLYSYRKENNYSFVLGEGSVEAKIMFIGEAPGEKEAKTGRPFVGASGRFLNELLQSIDMNREDVYITNIVKDRPPNNRNPSVKEIRLYQPFLLRQIEIIRPEVIVPLGRFSMEFILNQFNAPEKGQKISELHGKQLKGTAPYGEITIVPLYHPAVALYSVDSKQTLVNDFQMLKQFV
jgi:uracil-DNA glycosylase